MGARRSGHRAVRRASGRDASGHVHPRRADVQSTVEFHRRACDGADGAARWPSLSAGGYHHHVGGNKREITLSALGPGILTPRSPTRRSSFRVLLSATVALRRGRTPGRNPRHVDLPILPCATCRGTDFCSSLTHPGDTCDEAVSRGPVELLSQVIVRRAGVGRPGDTSHAGAAHLRDGATSATTSRRSSTSLRMRRWAVGFLASPASSCILPTTTFSARRRAERDNPAAWKTNVSSRRRAAR